MVGGQLVQAAASPGQLVPVNSDVLSESGGRVSRQERVDLAGDRTERPGTPDLGQGAARERSTLRPW